MNIEAGHKIFSNFLSMISYRKYQQLSPGRKAETLFEEGIYTQLTRRTKHMVIELYLLNDFYVELYFNALTQDPLFVKAFNGSEGLEPYLEMIAIDALFETK